MSEVLASFVIPTRNRDGYLAALLDSIARQTVATETLVMDDEGSTTLRDWLRDRFPAVRYYALGHGRGPTFQRNRGIELAASEFVFPLDDDTLLPSPRTVEQTLADFSDERIGAVAIPYVNVASGNDVHHRAPDDAVPWVGHAFTGASHALRRSRFLSVGGYREHFFYMGEEGDLCLRLLERGSVVRYGTADPVQHFESPIRNSPQADFCGRRNDIVFAWQNVPAFYLPAHLAGTTFKGVWSAFRAPNVTASLKGIVAGYAQTVTGQGRREPVRAGVYRLHRRLKKSGPLRLPDVEQQLRA